MLDDLLVLVNTSKPRTADSDSRHHNSTIFRTGGSHRYFQTSRDWVLSSSGLLGQRPCSRSYERILFVVPEAVPRPNTVRQGQSGECSEYQVSSTVWFLACYRDGELFRRSVQQGQGARNLAAEAVLMILYHPYYKLWSTPHIWKAQCQPSQNSLAT